MNRRECLALLGVGVPMSIAGCASDNPNENDDAPDGDDSTPTETRVTQVSVTDENYARENTINSISMRYNMDTRAEIQPPGSPARSPDPGNKFIVLHADITVESRRDGEIDMYGSAFVMQADGIVYDERSIRNLPEITQTVVPETTYEAWSSFEVPEDTTEATLRATDLDAWFDYPTEALSRPTTVSLRRSRRSSHIVPSATRRARSRSS